MHNTLDLKRMRLEHRDSGPQTCAPPEGLEKAREDGGGENPPQAVAYGLAQMEYWIEVKLKL